MAWQPEVGAGTARATDYHDFHTKLVQFMCGKHVATVAINAAGSGYAVGDTLTINDSVFTAAQHLEFVCEVTSISGGGGTGPITGLRIIARGSYAEQALSATVSAAGTGYNVNDVLQVQGGTNRLPAKFQVATLTGGAGTGVATVNLFEGGGVYTAGSTPSNPAATVGVGPNGFGGNDACTLTVTYSPLPTTLTARPTNTSGAGTSATIDVTFADTGWSVDSRDINSRSWNSLLNEKQTTLVADASGYTNKPYVHLTTGTETSGLDTRYFLSVLGSVAHNSALGVSAQPGLSPGHPAETTFNDGSSYCIFPQNQSNDIDFWFSADDRFVKFWYNENPSANTDDGRYLSGGAGFYDVLKTETEDPFPMIVWGCTRDRDINPTIANDNVTSIAEIRHPASGPIWYYRAEDSVWQELENNEASGVGQETDFMWPFGEVVPEMDGFDENFIVDQGPMQLNDSVIKRDRTSSTRVLRPVPGTVGWYLLMPLVFARKLANTPSITTDSVRGSIPDVFWIYKDDGSGGNITNFSEDYITIGSDRYRVFHNHVHTERYQYVAVKETV